ncbi:hypothetical protein GCM10010207_37780 [Streptomyces atratus]|nr:hypothetical protein GCM10010207_37780 [Streptomyces atratus]
MIRRMSKSQGAVADFCSGSETSLCRSGMVGPFDQNEYGAQRGAARTIAPPAQQGRLAVPGAVALGRRLLGVRGLGPVDQSGQFGPGPRTPDFIEACFLRCAN